MAGTRGKGKLITVNLDGVEVSLETLHHYFRETRPSKSVENHSGDDDEMRNIIRNYRLPQFNGKDQSGEEVEAWIERMEDYFYLGKFSERIKVTNAKLQLTGLARLWWKHYTKANHVDEDAMTWEEMKKQLLIHYAPEEYAIKRMNEFFALTQQGKKIDEYFNKFMTSQKYAPDLSERQKVSRFIEGLDGDLKFMVKSAEPSNLQSAFMKAKTYEEMLDEKKHQDGGFRKRQVSYQGNTFSKRNVQQHN